MDGEPEVSGNFLVEGPHWHYLERAIAHRAERMRLPFDGLLSDAALSLLPAAEVVLIETPDGCHAEMEEAVLEASSRLRLERQIAFDRPAVLRTRALRIRFSPVEGRSGHFFVPFAVRDGEQESHGLISLTGDRDPLPVLFEHASDEFILSAWAAALLGYAALTAPVMVRGQRRVRPLHPSGRAPARGGSRWVRARSAPSSVFSPELTYSGGHHRGAAHFVVGHRRQLFDGREPSDEAVARAADYGIRLHPDETWVRPHARGLSDGQEVEFRWAPRIALAD